MSNAHNHAPAPPTAPPILVDSPEALAELTERLRREPRIAVDTESNSLYAYREQVCLIQFTIPGADFILDPFAIEDLSPLGPIFADTEREKIFHAADYDLIVLHRDYGFTCGKLFDTMWAARVLGWPRVGLGNLLEEHFGVHLNKRYQRYDWGHRPLDPQAVSYARMDTHYLLTLRDLEAEALRKSGRLQEAREIFEYLRTTVSEPPNHEPDATFWRIKGMHALNRKEQRVLYQLHLWRETTAEQLDRPPFKVMSSKRLITLAQVQPRSRQALKAAGLTNHQLRRFGRQLLSVLRAAPGPLPEPPEDGEHPPDEVVDRYNTLHDWRKRVARARGVDSDVVLPNATLWALAWDLPASQEELLDVPGIGPWRQEAYGPDILALLEA